MVKSDSSCQSLPCTSYRRPSLSGYFICFFFFFVDCPFDSVLNHGEKPFLPGLVSGQLSQESLFQGCEFRVGGPLVRISPI